MTSGESDTSREAEGLQVRCFRSLSAAERLDITFALSQTVIDLSKQAIRRLHPHAPEREIVERWVRLHHGPEMADRLRDAPR